MELRLRLLLHSAAPVLGPIQRLATELHERLYAGERSPTPARPVRSARTRILGSYVLLLAGSALVSCLVLHGILSSRLDNEIEDALVLEATELDSLAEGTNPTTGEPFGEDLPALFDSFLRRNVPNDGEAFFTIVGGESYRASDNPPYDLLTDRTLVSHLVGLRQSERDEVRTPAGEARYLAVPLRFGDRVLGTFVVANFPAGERAEIRRAVQVLGGVSAGVLMVATVLAWLAAGRVLAPVRVLTATARRITDSDISQRIPVRGNDEIGELTSTFNQMLERLDAAFVSQRDFMQEAGHELRTPITVIRGHLELMGPDPEEQRETLALVNDELDRMTRYVNNLLLLARAEQPDFLRREPVEVQELTLRVFAKVRALAPRSWRLDVTGGGMVVLDGDRITQAVMNLATNAVQHTDEGQEVVIGATVTDGQVRFWVRDTGPGILPSDRERVFERFGRGRSVRRSGRGTGLGLAIVQAIVKAHGGRVELQSEPGEGATFTIVVPAQTPGVSEPGIEACSGRGR